MFIATGAEPTGATGKLPRCSWQYRGKHILLPRYFWTFIMVSVSYTHLTLPTNREV